MYGVRYVRYWYVAVTWPDGVALKHMLITVHEALHFLSQSIAITGITPPAWLKSHAILFYKKGIPRGLTITTPSHWSMLFTSFGPPV